MRPESEVPGLTPFLDSLKFGKADGLLVAIVQVRRVKGAGVSSKTFDRGWAGGSQ